MNDGALCFGIVESGFSEDERPAGCKATDQTNEALHRLTRAHCVTPAAFYWSPAAGRVFLVA